MAELQTLARPYARAVFEHAVAGNELAPWSEALARAAALAGDDVARPLLGHPRVSAAQQIGLFEAALGPQAPAGALNLVRVLVENRRLAALPAIAQTYEALRAEHERRSTVSITSASELDDARQQAIAAVLAKRLGTSVDVSWRVDPELIGGAVIAAGDLVIDGSVRGELDRLRARLTH